MKKITLLLLLFTISVVFSQAQDFSMDFESAPNTIADFNVTSSSGNNSITFETGEDGNTWTWTVFENDNNPALEVVTNPDASGVNTSATVAKFTARIAGANWAGVESAHGDFGPFTLSEANSTVKIMVYKTVISDVGMKFAINSGGAQPEIKVANTVINAWEELSFDFSGQIGTAESIDIDQIIVFPDFASRAQENVIYFDNISFSEKPVVSGTDARLSDLKVDGSTIAGFSMSTLDYDVELAAGTTVVPTITVTENDVNATAVVTAAASLPGSSSVVITAQDGTTTKTYTVAFTVGASSTIDDITFEPGEDGNDWTWAVFENDDNPALEVVSNPDASGANTSATVAKFTARTTGANWAGVESAHGGADVAPFTFDEANSTVKIMVYKTVISDVGLKFAESNGEAQPEIKVANTKINEWEELTFDFSGSIGKGITGIIDQVIVFPDYDSRSQENIVYFDNIKFSAMSGGGSEPTTAAPIPTQAEVNVISIFSDTYTDVASTNFNPGWGQSTIQSIEDIVGNPTLKYDNFNYQGTILGSIQDLSGMEFMHIDMWTSNATAVSVFPISVATGEKSVALTIEASEWKSYDIPLTEFTDQGLSMADIKELKFDGQSGVTPSTIYLDNIYFYKIDETTNATLGDLQIDGTTVPGFSSGTIAYDVELAFGTTIVPTVTATSTNVDANVAITPAVSLPGTTSILVTAEDGTTTMTYTIAMTVRAEVSTDASLSSISIDDTAISGFDSETLAYEFGVPEGTTVVPTVTVSSTDIAADVQITAATEIPGTTAIVVTAEDGVTTVTYTVAFSIKEELTLSIDFEGGSYDFVDFDGGTATVITNPQSSGINTSATVAQIVRDGGAIWAGSKLELSDNIDFSSNNTFSMKVYSPRVDVPVRFKLESSSGGWAQVEVNTTVANEWETLNFDFTGTASDTYNQLVFMFDFEATGDGSANSTFLFDDIEFYDVTGGLDQIDLPVDFESSTVFYELTDFGGAATELTVDPSNSSNTVATTIKTAGAATWAGTTIGTNRGFASVIPITESETVISMKVFSPAAGTTVRMKAEDHNDVTLTVETEAVTTVANSWEILTFDFSNVATGTNPFNLSTNFDKVSVFFDFGNEGSGDTYYWDDVMFGASSCVDIPKPEITVDNNNSAAITLTSSSDIGNQWFKDASVIVGGTESTLEVTSVGVYTVQVSVEGCKSPMSDELPIIITDLDEISNLNISVYPNPTSASLEILGLKGQPKDIQLLDVSGKSTTVRFNRSGNVFSANIENVPNGIYVLIIQSENVNHKIRIIKK